MSSEKEANYVDLNSSDVVKSDDVITSSESNVAGLKAESMSGNLVVDSLRNGSNETERTHSSISTKSEYEDINHDVVDKANVFDKLQADEEPGIGNKNIMNATSEEKKLAADEELLEDIVQPVEGSYVTNTLEQSV